PCNGPNPRPPIIALVMVTDQPLDDDLSVLILKGTIDHSPPPVIGAAIVEHANFTRASEEPLGPLKTCPELLERDPIHVCRSLAVIGPLDPSHPNVVAQMQFVDVHPVGVI